jgi:hypothetical protein
LLLAEGLCHMPGHVTAPDPYSSGEWGIKSACWLEVLVPIAWGLESIEGGPRSSCRGLDGTRGGHVFVVVLRVYREV